MSTVKISELALITQLNANTSNTLFLAVDLPTGVTGKFTGHTLAQGLYSNEVLNVGNNAIVYQNVIGQFSGNSGTYLQVNNQNFDANGSSDYVASTNDSDNTTKFIDMGVNGSNFSDPVYSSMKPYDGYVYTHGPADVDYRGNLVIGTASSSANIVLIAGGTTSANIVGRIGANIFDFLKNVRVTGTITPSGGIVFSDGTTQTTSSEGTVGYANSAFIKANAAFITANTPPAIANSAALYANGAFIQANAAFLVANTPTHVANSAALYANGAFLVANTPTHVANSAALYANGAFIQANAAFITANTPDAIANSAALYANGAFVQANAAFITANTPTHVANSAALYANAAFLQANTPSDVANSAALYANGAFVQANAAFLQANTPSDVANSAALYANAAFLQANTPSDVANSAALYANGAFVQANAAFLQANTPSDVANSAALYANGAFVQANAAFLVANTPTHVANSAALYANAAFAKANSALANTSGAIFAGNLNILGNVTMLGVAAAGQLTVNTALTSATEAAVRITGSNNAVVIEPQNDGYMLQITGKENLPTRVILDSFGANTYGLLAGRSARGTASAPTATQNNDVLLRLAGNGYGTTGFAPLGVSRIDIVAAENFTDTARGSRIKFYNVTNGSNTVTEIASFNADTVTFTGVVNPEKGFIYTPRIPAGNQTAITINYAIDSMIKANLVADLTVSHSNFITGKVVEVWLVNTGGVGRTVTHGLTATNSTTNSTTFTIAGTSSAYLKFFSIDGDLANTFVSVVYA